MRTTFPICGTRWVVLGVYTLTAITTIFLVPITGCAPNVGGSPDVDVLVVEPESEALDPVEFPLPGTLLLKEGHGIGGYDAFLVPESTIRYRRGSRPLPPDLEAGFLASLEQTLVDAAEEADIPVVHTRGRCVMEVSMDLREVDIEPQGRSRLGRMNLVMEFRDTLTDEPLLRYVREHEIPSQGTATRRGAQLKQAFAKMVASMEIGGALRAAGLAEDAERAGCRGTLAARGSASVRPPVSTR